MLFSCVTEDTLSLESNPFGDGQWLISCRIVTFSDPVFFFPSDAAWSDSWRSFALLGHANTFHELLRHPNGIFSHGIICDRSKKDLIIKRILSACFAKV